jgi:ElaB/YqjD/DUF883 family membrane-anchored ribosome-binding protein
VSFLSFGNGYDQTETDSNYYGKLKIAINEFIKKGDQKESEWKTLVDYVGSVEEDTKDFIKKTLANLKDSLSSQESWKQNLKDKKERAKENFEEGKEFLKEKFEAGERRAKEIKYKYFDKTNESSDPNGQGKSVFEKVKEKFEQIGQDMKDKAMEKGEDLKDKAKEALEGAKDKAEELKDRFMEKGEDLKDKAKEALEGAKDRAEELKDRFMEKGEDLKDKAKGTLEGAKDRAEELKDRFKKKVKKMGEKTLDNIGIEDQKLNRYWTQISDTVSEQLSNARNKILEIRQNIMKKIEIHEKSSDITDIVNYSRAKKKLLADLRAVEEGLLTDYRSNEEYWNQMFEYYRSKGFKSLPHFKCCDEVYTLPELINYISIQGISFSKLKHISGESWPDLLNHIIPCECKNGETGRWEES